MDSVFYFLGNITSHAIHALPLYEKFGGTFVVLSKKAQTELKKSFGLDSVYIDDKPYRLTRFGHKIKPIHHYSKIDADISKTIEYINQNASIVLFYELFDFSKNKPIEPKKIFLTHGNMIKNYMGEGDRVSIMKQYDFMSSLGPHLKDSFINLGIPKEKLLDIGIARCDKIYSYTGRVENKMIKYGALKDKKVVSYLPTFWGASSIYNIGLDIIRNISDEYTLIFKPHPQTPYKILKKYLKIIRKKDNIIYIDKCSDISVDDILISSDAFICDMSSLTLEAMLTRKPIIFTNDSRSKESDFSAIKKVVKKSSFINKENSSSINSIIEYSINNPVPSHDLESTLDAIFYTHDGDFIDEFTKILEKVK